MRMGKQRFLCLLAALAMAAALCGTCPGEDDAQPAAGGAQLPAGEKYVALTFDDGPKAGTTDVLLDGLLERRASATFFLIGRQIEANQALVERMAAEGHQVGNHTWNHTRLEGADAALISREVGQTDRLLRELLGPGEYWVLPPYGGVDETVRGTVTVPMVKWSVDPRDWESLNADQVVQAVMEAVETNSIILLHDIYPSSVEAALRLVDRLRQEGYELVTVRELLALNGIEPENGVLYCSGDH